jgi:translation initiation factor IF-3
MFRGRETTHPERGRDLLLRLAEDVKEIGQIESQPLLDGRNMVMVLGPTKAAGEKKVEEIDEAPPTEALQDEVAEALAAAAPAEELAQEAAPKTEAKAAAKPKAEKSEAKAAAEPEAASEGT